MSGSKYRTFNCKDLFDSTGNRMKRYRSHLTTNNWNLVISMYSECWDWLEHSKKLRKCMYTSGEILRLTALAILQCIIFNVYQKLTWRWAYLREMTAIRENRRQVSDVWEVRLGISVQVTGAQQRLAVIGRRWSTIRHRNRRDCVRWRHGCVGLLVLLLLHLSFPFSPVDQMPYRRQSSHF